MAGQWAYFDTSVLVKRYVREPGSRRARVLLRRYRFLSSAIAPLEVISALVRRQSAGELTKRN
ncbi:MAG: type II toxin-antitoxin system VapC family toxin, partial [Candidatus Methylomirabilales bacterium]